MYAFSRTLVNLQTVHVQKIPLVATETHVKPNAKRNLIDDEA
jgi:hypothetical protein